MELILLEKVQNLGDLGDRVNVKPGFGRNFLVPQGIAVPATKANIERFEARREELERMAAEKLGTAEARLTALQNVEAEFTVNASAEGKLYGSVGPRELADYLTEKGYAVEKSEVVMGDGPIRHIGHYDVVLQLHADVTTSVHVVISPEDGPAPIMEELFEDEEEVVVEAVVEESAEEEGEAEAESAEASSDDESTEAEEASDEESEENKDS